MTLPSQRYRRRSSHQVEIRDGHFIHPGFQIAAAVALAMLCLWAVRG